MDRNSRLLDRYRAADIVHRKAGDRDLRADLAGGRDERSRQEHRDRRDIELADVDLRLQRLELVGTGLRGDVQRRAIGFLARDEDLASSTVPFTRDLELRE